jgi:Tfp pilus assembly protein PilO
MTTINKKTARPKTRQSLPQRARRAALKAGAVKLLALSAILSVGVALLFQHAVASPQITVNEALSQQLEQKRRQNALARAVQQTKPEFLQEFRRLITNYTTARELLPSETEVSNVLDSIQQMSKSNGVKVTMFDASKPGAKSANLAAPAAASADPKQPQVTLNERVIPAQIQGPHPAVVRFLNAISRYQRIIYIREFSITSLNREETVNLTLVTYDAPTSGILPPIPSELRNEFQSQGANTTDRLADQTSQRKQQ